jgi:hypothetical protein
MLKAVTAVTGVIAASSGSSSNCVHRAVLHTKCVLPVAVAVHLATASLRCLKDSGSDSVCRQQRRSFEQ